MCWVGYPSSIHFIILGEFDKHKTSFSISQLISISNSIINNLSFGCGTINDTIVHYGNPHIAFGGVGNSGYGAYHGKNSFDTFSHRKGILKKSSWIDIPLRYPPYKGKQRLIKTFIK